MNEAELIEAMTSFFDLGISTFGIWLSLTSGYLVVAHLAGNRLPRVQYFVLNSLYFVTASICAVSSTSFALMGVEYQITLGGLVETGSLTVRVPVSTENPNLLPMLFVGALLAGELAAIYFMWNTRRTSCRDKPAEG
jgi:hypothetical protein